MSAFIGLPFAKAKNYAKFTLVLKYVAAVIILIIGAGLVYIRTWSSRAGLPLVVVMHRALLLA